MKINNIQFVPVDANIKGFKTTKEALSFRASFIDNIWYAIGANNKKYPIEIPDNPTSHFEYIFSSHANDYWPIGTIKKHKSVPGKVDEIGEKYWTIFKEDLTIIGTIVDNKFKVDWKKHIKLCTKLYHESNRFKKELSNDNRRIY